MTHVIRTEMVNLSEATRRHVATLFPRAEVALVEELLARECAEKLPLIGDRATPASMERFRFAALRFSGGSLDRLRAAIALAKTDWRDLLVAAGFAHDPRAHEAWRPAVLTPSRLGAWQAGEALDGVDFKPNDEVEVTAGPTRARKGSVIALVALEPSPRYLVALESGGEIEASQLQLRRAG